MMCILMWMLGISLLLFIGFIYFMPSIVAQTRKHHNRYAIFVLNFFLGWSFMGWVVSLSWALTKVESK